MVNSQSKSPRKKVMKILFKNHLKSSRPRIRLHMNKFRETCHTFQASQLVSKFGDQSNIHGLNHMLSFTSSRFKKSIWILILILAIAGSVNVCLKLSHRFRRRNFQTVIETINKPIYQIQFPVVTICNENHLNWHRIEEAKNRFIPNERDHSKLQLFERIVGAYDDLQFANFDKFSVLRNESLEQMNHINFSSVVDFMTWRCEEFLTECVWNHKSYNCCEIFSRRKTKSGYCWSFNTLENDEGRQKMVEDPYYPWHNSGAGLDTGLKAKVLLHPEMHYPYRKNKKGLKIMLAQPNCWDGETALVPENTHTLVIVEPIIFFYTSKTRRVSSANRKCVFDDERSSNDFKSLQGYIYMVENCESQCHQEYLVYYCNCTLNLMFPPGPYRACTITDLLCLAKYNEYFQRTTQAAEKSAVSSDSKEMICQCMTNCYSIHYNFYTRQILFLANPFANESRVNLDVFYRFDTMKVYRTSFKFEWVDLLADFGGVAALFLGCSIIAIIELFFFICFELPYNWAKSTKKLNHSEIGKTSPIYFSR